MIKEEKILTHIMGKENHFKVPEGYFEQLTEQVMANLPEREACVIRLPERSLWQRIPLRKIAASVAVVCALGGGVLAVLHQQQAAQGNMAASSALLKSATLNQVSSEDDTFNEMANYTMMDNETIYASLVAEN